MSSKRLDITDQIFHRLQAIVIDWYKTKKTGKTHWFCQCECGDIVSVYLSHLKSGHTKSCGCLSVEKAIERREDLTGQTFTRWFVDSYNPEKSKEMGLPYWNVTCTNDGNKGCVRGSHLKSGGSKSCGCLNREKASENMTKLGKKNSREKHYNWKGGVTPLQESIRKSKKYKEFTQICLKKVNYTCLISQKTGDELHVHHIKGFAKILEENNITTKRQAMKCKELWDENNIVVLSEKWHVEEKIDNSLAFHRLYGKINFTEEDFYEWFEFILKLKLLEYKLINFNFWLESEYDSI